MRIIRVFVEKITSTAERETQQAILKALRTNDIEMDTSLCPVLTIGTEKGLLWFQKKHKYSEQGPPSHGLQGHWLSLNSSSPLHIAGGTSAEGPEQPNGR